MIQNLALVVYCSMTDCPSASVKLYKKETRLKGRELTPSKCALRSGRHHIRFIQYNQLETVRGCENHASSGKVFDLFSNDFDASLVRSV